MRRILVCIAIGPLLLASPASAQGTREPLRVLVIGADRDELFQRFPLALGIGVYPSRPNRDAFLGEIGKLHPGDSAYQGSALLFQDGVSILQGSFVEGFARKPSSTPLSSDPKRVLGFVLQSKLQTGGLTRFDRWDRVFLLDMAPGSSRVVGLYGREGILAGGVSRRNGILTPYDITATLLDLFKVPIPSTSVGESLTVHRGTDSRARLVKLRARFERDAHFGRGLAVATVVFGLVPLLLALAFARTSRKGLSKRLLRASAAAPAGYVIALFIPHGNWAVRAIALACTTLIGALWRTNNMRRFIGWVFVLTAAAVAVLAVAAELNPNGEPALSLWGNPLTSWRFFGLRNHLAAFIAGGAIVGLLLLEVPLVVGVTGAAAALVVTGAPRLGANFIGVLTLGFGVALGLLVIWRRRFEIWQLFAAGLFGLGATFVAFLSDVGSPVSHGGRAAQTVRAGGFRAGWDIFAERARLNYREVIDIPVPLAGPVAFVAVTILLGALLVWAYRARNLNPYIRAAAAGGTAAAFAALFVEDSGFFTGGILALYPATAFLLVLLDGGGDTTTPPLRGSEDQPPLLRA